MPTITSVVFDGFLSDCTVSGDSVPHSHHQDFALGCDMMSISEVVVPAPRDKTTSSACLCASMAHGTLFWVRQAHHFKAFCPAHVL